MTVKKQGDDYVHFGLLNSVRRILCESKPIISDQKINLIVSVGGILLYKSIIAKFWSILCCFHKLPSFNAGICYFNKNPSIQCGRVCSWVFYKM